MSGQRLGQIFEKKKKKKKKCVHNSALIQIYIVCSDLIFFDIFGVQFLRVNENKLTKSHRPGINNRFFQAVNKQY